MLGVDALGLELIDRKILTTLLRNPTPVGIKTLSVAVGEEEQTIEEVYEPFLIQEGFIMRTARGRRATVRAYKHLDYEGIPDDGTDYEESSLFG